MPQRLHSHTLQVKMSKLTKLQQTPPKLNTSLIHSEMLEELHAQLTPVLDQLKEDKEPDVGKKKRRKRRRSPNPRYPTGDQKREWTNEYKACGCKKCGEPRLHVIDLHHTNPKTKKFGISRGIRLAVTEKEFRAELRKTVPLCRCCHGDYHFQNSRTGISTKDYINGNTRRIAG